MKKIKVLQSMDTLGVGGVEIFVMNMFRNIDCDKFQFDFLIYDESKKEFYDEVIQKGSTVHYCKKKYTNKFLEFLWEIRQINRILDKTDYDIIHCHSCSLFGILRAAIPARRHKHMKVISHAHNPGMSTGTFFDTLSRKALKSILSHTVDYGLTCSDVAGESKYTKKFRETPRYRMINNAIDTQRYVQDVRARNEIRERLKIDDGAFVVGNIGRLEKQKNQFYLIDIFEKIHDKNTNSVLLIVGGGSLEAQLRKKAADKGLTDYIIFTGVQKSAEIFYQAMDCFVLPSIYEGFPFVLVEAQVNGLNCFISDVITKTANISGGVNFISLSASADEWADEILKLGQKRMDKEQIEKVKSAVELKNVVNELESVYTEALDFSRK